MYHQTEPKALLYGRGSRFRGESDFPKSWEVGAVEDCSSGLLTPHPLLLLLYNMYHTVTKAYTALKTLLKEPLFQEVSSGLP